MKTGLLLILWLSASRRQPILREPCWRRSRSRRATGISHGVTMPRRRGRRVVEVGEGLAFDGSAHDAFERADHILVFIGDQRERIACALCASRAPDAVDVRVGSVGHVIVNNVRDALNIETARRNVGGDHDVEVPAFETVQGVLALPLCAVAVQARDAMTRVRDLPRHFIGAMFRAREDQNRIRIGLLEQAQQQSRFQMRWHGIQRVRHSDSGLADAHRNALRVRERLRSEQFHLSGEGRGEQHGLSLRWHGFDDSFYIGQKTHVEHAVAFIEH